MGRRYCCVPDCPNFLGTWDSSVRFFVSPKDPELKVKWEQALNRPSTSNFRLCYLHFDEKDIVRRRKEMVLKPGAIPKPVLVPKTEDAPVVKIVDIDTITKRSRLCGSCIQYDVKLQAANVKITKLEERVIRLIKKNQTMKKTLNNHTIKDRLLSRIKEVKKCSLCEVKLTAAESERHFCIEQENFICPSCPWLNSNTFQSTNSFLEHVSQHNKLTIGDNRSLFRCNQCSIGYPMDILLKCHQMSHDKIKPVISKTVDETANGDTTVQQPSGSKPQRTLIKLFKCGLCDDTFRTTTDLAHHMRITHRKRVKRLQCYVCKLGDFATLPKLRIHMKSHETCNICKMVLEFNAFASHLCGDERIICCDYCPNQFTSTSALVEHLKNAHENNKKFYGCESCSKCFPMLILKKFHMKSHDKPRPFVCEICSKSFSSKENLKKHQTLHNQTESHLCDECGYGFRTARGLMIHKNSYIHKPNGDTAIFQCPDCPRKFNNSQNFRAHSAVHREHKYICEICQTELLSKTSYKNHLKTHQRTEADRVYACKLCPRKFFDPQTLRNHRLVHTGSRSHSCRFCGTTYKYSGDLNKHLKTHLGNIHECKKCLKRFQYPRELQKHEFEHYKEEKLANEMNC